MSSDVWVYEGMSAGKFVANAKSTLDSLVLQSAEDIAILSEVLYQAGGQDPEAVLHIIENDDGSRSLSWVEI